MKYFILLAGDGELLPFDQQTPDQQQSDMAKHGAFGEACQERSGVEMPVGEAGCTLGHRIELGPANWRRCDR